MSSSTVFNPGQYITPGKDVIKHLEVTDCISCGFVGFTLYSAKILGDDWQFFLVLEDEMIPYLINGEYATKILQDPEGFGVSLVKILRISRRNEPED